MTITPPVSVVSSAMSSLPSVTMAPLFNGASYNVGSAWCGSATTPDPKGHWMCSWSCLCAMAATSIFDISSGLCQFCCGFSTGRFLFQTWASYPFVSYMFGVCSGVCCLLSGSMLDAISTLGCLTIGVCTIATSWSLSVAAICDTCWWLLAHTRYAQSAAPSTTLSRGSLMLLHLLFPSHPIYMVGHTALGAWQRVTQSLHLPYMVGRDLLFQVLFYLMTQLTLNLQWALNLGDSGVVIGYQGDEFTHIWSAEQFVAHSHIYPGFTGKFYH